MRFESEGASQIPPSMFEDIKKVKERLISAGVNVIDLGMGDPDLPAHVHIAERLREELAFNENVKHQNFNGCKEFRNDIAYFYKKRFNVELDPETDVLALIGCKEGITDLIPSLIDPGEYELIPNLIYPGYRTATYLANGKCHTVPITEDGFWVRF